MTAEGARRPQQARARETRHALPVPLRHGAVASVTLRACTWQASCKRFLGTFRRAVSIHSQELCNLMSTFSAPEQAKHVTPTHVTPTPAGITEALQGEGLSTGPKGGDLGPLGRGRGRPLRSPGQEDEVGGRGDPCGARGSRTGWGEGEGG